MRGKMPMTLRLSPLAVWLGCLGSLLISTSAEAQGGAIGAVAAQLFDDGTALTAAGDYAAACPKFAESQRLDPQLGTMLHLADCYEHEGKIASAWALFRDAAELAAARQDDRAALARSRTAGLAAKVPRLGLTVNASPPQGFELRMDGEVMGSAAWGTPMPVNPGQHTISAGAPGYQPWVATVDSAADGRTAWVAVPTLVPLPAAEPPLPTEAAPPPGDKTPPVDTREVASTNGDRPYSEDAGRRESRTPTLGIVLGGAGAVLAAVGVGFGVRMREKVSERDGICPSRNDCVQDDLDESAVLTESAQKSARVANTLYVAGGAAMTAGVILIISGRSQPKPLAGLVEAHPWVSRTGAGLAVGGRF
ncbi:MAG: hypothetical protein JW751_28625 [Polyangiaceae bacterium]|nr:hypothetical protein [Polyangiaceae bacterium]